MPSTHYIDLVGPPVSADWLNEVDFAVFTTVREIQSGSITTTPSDSSVTTSKLADGAVTSAKLAPGAAISNIGPGTVTRSQLAQPLTRGVPVSPAGAAGALITGIPSWATRVTIVISGLTSSGVAPNGVRLALGTSSGVVHTGYDVTTSSVYVGGTAIAGTAVEVVLGPTGGLSGQSFQGIVTLVNLGGNTWTISGTTGLALGAAAAAIGGSVTLPGVLDRINIYITAGISTFSSGSINILYE